MTKAETASLIDSAREIERKRQSVLSHASFAVILSKGSHSAAVGPYRSYRAAEGDANAWNVPPMSAYVLPIFSPKATTAEILECLEPL